MHTYTHTRIRCEGVRPDVQHLDQSMMTYPWFRIKQARHFNNITFPNKIYNPYKEEGYSMEHFLRANARDRRRPAFLCGGWYHDEKPAHAGGGTPGLASPLSSLLPQVTPLLSPLSRWRRYPRSHDTRALRR